MTLEELAEKMGGFYSAPVLVAGTEADPKFRVAFVNTENVIAMEINGEAQAIQGLPAPE